MEKFIITVEKDENLKSICTKFKVNPQSILELNNISETNIVYGVRLLIEIPIGQKYTVKPFENVESIAKKFSTTVDKLQDNNKVKEVHIGQIIYIV